MNYLNVGLDFKLGTVRSFGDQSTTPSKSREAKDEVGGAKKPKGYWGIGLNYHMLEKKMPRWLQASMRYR
jgi:hypothetical protein